MENHLFILTQLINFIYFDGLHLPAIILKIFLFKFNFLQNKNQSNVYKINLFEHEKHYKTPFTVLTNLYINKQIRE